MENNKNANEIAQWIFRYQSYYWRWILAITKTMTRIEYQKLDNRDQ